MEYTDELKSKDNLPLVLSDRLHNLLRTINSKVTHKILSMRGSQSSITLLDIGDNGDMITLAMSPKIKEFINKKYESSYKRRIVSQNLSIEPDLWSANRIPMKAGRVIKKLVGDQFTDHDIEIFVNSYKSLSNASSLMSLFDLVKGNDIVHWYLRKNYAKNISNSTLYNSCMSKVSCSPAIKFYASNPKKVSLLILYENDKKTTIIGRALVWNLSKPNGKVFMDRVYATKDYYIDIFKNYAKQHGWLFKDRQQAGDSTIIDSSTNKFVPYSELEVSDIELSKSYPYIDSLCILDQDNKKLSTRGLTNDVLYLRNAHGGPPRDCIWSKFYNKHINIYSGNVQYVICSVAYKGNINDFYRLKVDAIHLPYYNSWIAKSSLSNKVKLVETTYGEKKLVLAKDAVWLKHYDAFTTKLYASTRMTYSKYYKDYIDNSEVVVGVSNIRLFKSLSMRVFKNQKKSKSEMIYIPIDKIGNLTTLIDGELVFKSIIRKKKTA